MTNDPSTSTPVPATKGRPKLPKESLGRVAYSDKHLAKDFSLPLNKKGELVREKWGNTALVLALRAQKAAQTYSKKDFNALYRLVLAGSIAMDKAFPPTSQPLGTNLVVNLFSSLGQGQVEQILQPKLPKVEILSIDTQVELPSNQPLDEST